MRKYILPALALITLLICSCSTTTSVSHYSTRKATNKTRYVSQSNIITFPMLVDLDVENRLVTGTFSGTSVNEEFAKSMAVASAIKQASADVLVEPFFDITVNDNDISAIVIGHPAHYKNFRKVPLKDDKNAEAKTPSVKVKAVVQDKKTEEKKVVEEKKEEEIIKTEEKIIKEEPVVEEEAEEVIVKPQTAPIKEEEPVVQEEDNSGKLKTPCFLISCAAMAKESDARAAANDLSRKGLNANYLWIPDYDRAGKSLYKVYVGPYKTREEAENMLSRVKPYNSGAYVQQLK